MSEKMSAVKMAVIMAPALAPVVTSLSQVCHKSVTSWKENALKYQMTTDPETVRLREVIIEK